MSEPTDIVQVLKQESAALSGSASDEFDYPSPIEPQEDVIEMAGLQFQDQSNRDGKVKMWRSSGSMMFKDEFNPVAATLTDLLALASGSGITAVQHEAIRQLIHFIDEGPGYGFATGAYKETLPSGDMFPTSVVWWESNLKTKKIVEKTITRSGGGATNIRPTPIVWNIYDTDGVTILHSVSDSISYNGVVELSRTRTIT